MPVRARMVLKVKAVWMFPLVIPLVLIVLMTFIYIGSVLDPPAHLHGLPVLVVNQDAGATVNGEHFDEGATFVHTVTGAHAVTTKLDLRPETMAEAEAEMDRGGAYAAIVIPSGFTASFLAAAGDQASAPEASAGLPTVNLSRTCGSGVWA